jgi:hypothetical protein
MREAKGTLPSLSPLLRPDHAGVIQVAQSLTIGKSNTNLRHRSEQLVIVERSGNAEWHGDGEHLRKMTQRRGVWQQGTDDVTCRIRRFGVCSDLNLLGQSTHREEKG